MLKLLLRTSALTLAICAHATAQLPQRERLLAMGVRIDVRAPSYTPVVADSMIVFSETLRESLVVEVGFGNSTDANVNLGALGAHWAAALKVNLTKKVAGEQEDLTESTVFQVMMPQTSGFQAPVLSIAPGRSRQFRFALRTRNGLRLSNGHYELVISLDQGALDTLARRHMNILTRKVSFEVREPTTNSELADAYLQLSYLDRLAGRFDESREWAQRVLTINPVSIPALTDQAAAWLSQGICAQAVPLFERAIRLLETGADSQLQMPGLAQAESVGNLRSIVKSRCPGPPPLE